MEQKEENFIYYPKQLIGGTGDMTHSTKELAAGCGGLEADCQPGDASKDMGSLSSGSSAFGPS